MRQLFLLIVVAAGAAAQIQEISGERIRAHVKFLASDLLEGRGVGTRGGDLATEYLASQMALVAARMGTCTGDNYLQACRLSGDPEGLEA